MWCIPPKQSAEEDGLEVYQQPPDPQRPVVCVDKTFRQLIGEVREPQPVQPGAAERFDSVYVRNGVVSAFLAFEPLAGGPSETAISKSSLSSSFLAWRGIHHTRNQSCAHFITYLY